MPTGKQGSTADEQQSLLRLMRGHKNLSFQYTKHRVLVNQLKSFKFPQTSHHEFASFILKDT